MRSCCHTSVTSDDMVTVMVTSHMIQERIKKVLEKMMLYNMCNTY